MAHKFYKQSNRLERLPKHVSDEAYGKLQKKAHPVWSVEAEGEDMLVSRNADEPEPNHLMSEEDAEDILPEQIVLLLLSYLK